MKMYVKRGSIFPKEESEAEKNQTKENRTSKKDLPAYLTTQEMAQWEEVTPRIQERRKGPLRTWNSRYGKGTETKISPAAGPTATNA